jgi:hypothetical protein
MGNIEFMDVKSNETLVTELLTSRLSNGTLPQVAVILGPESQLGFVAAPIASPQKIANILTSTNPDPFNTTPLNGTESTFYIEAPAQYTFRTMMEKYLDVGVKTLVVVALSEESDFYNYNSCIYTGRTLAEPFGIDSIEFTYGTDASDEELTAIIMSIRDVDPDAVFWCDWQSMWFENDAHRFPLKMFKKLDYLPKAFSMLDVFDANVWAAEAFQEPGYLDYVGAGSFVNYRLKGQEYTQENRPYSALFRPSAPETSVLDVLVCGSTEDSPSSVRLFHDWFLNTTGAPPIYQTNGLWAAFDLVEAALYRASQISSFVEDGVLQGDEVLPFFYDAQTVGPYGRVIFDERRINTPTPSIFVQLIPGEGGLPAIVAPSSQKNHEFVYPMPTWGEREYVWSYFKSPYIVATTAIGAVATTVLLAMAVTITIHRKG